MPVAGKSTPPIGIRPSVSRHIFEVGFGASIPDEVLADKAAVEAGICIRARAGSLIKRPADDSGGGDPVRR
jgi:hypothetical protein